MTFYFLPADIVSQILNFGLPAPIDIQIVGQNIEANRQYADQLFNQVKYVPGTTDLRIQQPFNSPKLQVEIDRTKSQGGGLYGTRCCEQPAGCVERKFPDSADVLAESG